MKDIAVYCFWSYIFGIEVRVFPVLVNNSVVLSNAIWQSLFPCFVAHRGDVGVFDVGVFDRGVFNRGVFDRGVSDRGVFNVSRRGFEV